MSSSLPVAGPVNVIGNDPVIVVEPVEITPTVAFPCTCTATITGPSTTTAPRMTMLRARSSDHVAPGRMTMMRRPA